MKAAFVNGITLTHGDCGVSRNQLSVWAGRNVLKRPLMSIKLVRPEDRLHEYDEENADFLQVFLQL